MFKNLFGEAFGRIAPESCRMTYNGSLAIKVAGGYRAWNPKTGRLTNVTNFTFPVGGDFIFVMPTTKVKAGDVILHAGRPKAVVSVSDEPESIQAVNYETGTIETIVPERHIFMGKTYFFGKLVSLFGKNMFQGKGCQGIMKMMMLKEFMGGSNQTADGGMSNMFAMAMAFGDGTGIFNFDEVGDLELMDTEEEDEEVELLPAKKKPVTKKKK